MKKEKILLAIDGPVGVGKSTLMKKLELLLGYKAYPEPVVDNPLLDKFYHDRKRYSFALQMFFLNKRFDHIKQTSGADKAVLDRSIYGDVIFAKMLHDNNEMSFDEFNIYKDTLTNMLDHCRVPTLMINLEVSVDEAIKRIQKRGRDYEQIVEREYWDTLNKEYRSFFNSYNHSPLLTINVDNLNFEENEEDLQYVLDLIQDKLDDISKQSILA